MTNLKTRSPVSPLVGRKKEAARLLPAGTLVTFEGSTGFGPGVLGRGKEGELDVQLAALRSFKNPREPRRKTQLINELIERRGRQEKKLRKAVDDDTVREAHKRLKRARKDFKPEASRDPLAVARGMLERIHRDNGPMTEALLHQYRIATKRARYAAELAADSAEAEQCIDGLKRIQDAAGDWDCGLTVAHTPGEHLG